ncbi:MAG: hypothetical protein KC964_23425 [Candidatus Omnitrophica bacterium]|nr:hypothetical protein [Candidatus Omnitrophota bacterium]
MIQKILFCIGLTVLIVSGSFAATITVSGGTGLQAAIDSANPGDTVEVTDSLTYAEDVLVNKDDLVLVCTAIDPATIEAQNNTLRGDLGQLIADLGAPSANDELGLYIEADGVTVDHFNIVNRTAGAGDNALGRACALNVHGSDNTVQNCAIIGPNNTNNDCAVQIGWGDISAGNLTQSTVATGRACNNNTLDNCHFMGRQGVHLHDVVYEDFGATNPQPTMNGLISNSTFECVRRALETRGDIGWTFDNCTWIHPAATTTDSAIKSFGGSATYNNCRIHGAGHRISFQPGAGGGSDYPTTVMNNCVICAGQPGDNVILMDEGNYVFTNCIISASSGGSDPAMNFFNNGVLHCRPAQIDGSWGAGNNAALGATWSLDVDHCDIMGDGGPSANFATGIYIDNVPDFFNGNGPYPYLVTVRDSIILANQGIVVNAGEVIQQLFAVPGVNPSPGSTITVENNAVIDLFDPEAPKLGSQGRIQVDFSTNWTDGSSPALFPGNNLIDVDPEYIGNVLDCSNPDYATAFIYRNEQMSTYASDGGPIGSQGTPPVPPSSVDGWELYQ